MIERLIHGSLANRSLVLAIAFLLAIASIYSVRQLPLDAIPDLSDVQVIIKTPYPRPVAADHRRPGHLPAHLGMLSVPGANAVRGFSMFGESFVYVIFKDGTDPYWARSRVLEYLSQVASKLPPGVDPQLGPDASGVGWVYQYALVDRSIKHDPAELRALQDWLPKYELQSLPGVAEVASVGGMVRHTRSWSIPAAAGYGISCNEQAMHDSQYDRRRLRGNGPRAST